MRQWGMSKEGNDWRIAEHKPDAQIRRQQTKAQEKKGAPYTWQQAGKQSRQ